MCSSRAPGQVQRGAPGQVQRGPEVGQLRAKGRMGQERTGTDGAWGWGVRPEQAWGLGVGSGGARSKAGMEGLKTKGPHFQVGA